MPTNGIRIKNLGEFRDKLKRYMEVTKRTLPEVLNTKAFYIARGACRKTLKADKEKIRSELGTGGRPKKVKVTTYNRWGLKQTSKAPLAALIINARNGPGGGLYGEDMRIAVAKFIAGRMRSIAFLKAGWLPAIKTLNSLAKDREHAPEIDPAAKQIGKPKGSAIPARGKSMKAFAVIINSAGENKNNHGALEVYGLPAFIKAWENEMKSMEGYIQNKMKLAALEHGFKTN